METGEIAYHPVGFNLARSSFLFEAVMEDTKQKLHKNTSDSVDKTAPTYTFTYDHDSAGNRLVRESHTIFDATRDGNSRITTIYEYDSFGRISFLDRFSQDVDAENFATPPRLWNSSGDAIEYDLRLMSVNNASDIPRCGKNLVLVAIVGEILHIRVFDHNGIMVVDTSEREHNPKAKPIQALKVRLNGLWPPHKLSKIEKIRILDNITSIFNYISGNQNPINLSIELVTGRFANLYIDNYQYLFTANTHKLIDLSIICDFCSVIEPHSNATDSDFWFIVNTVSCGVLMASVEEKFEDLLVDLSENFNDRLTELTRINHIGRQAIAKKLTPALNTVIQEMKQETLEQKKAICDFVEKTLEPLGLAVKVPNSPGLPGKLKATSGNHPNVGSFYFEAYIDGKRKTPSWSDILPELELIDATPAISPETPWQEKVGPKSSRRSPKRG